MSVYEEFIKTIKEDSKSLAKDLFDDFGDEAKRDTNAFLKKTNKDLQRWTTLLSQGLITEADFSDLLQAQKALAKITALRQKGIALAKLERFRTGLIALIVDAAFSIF